MRVCACVCGCHARVWDCHEVIWLKYKVSVLDIPFVPFVAAGTRYSQSLVRRPVSKQQFHLALSECIWRLFIEHYPPSLSMHVDSARNVSLLWCRGVRRDTLHQRTYRHFKEIYLEKASSSVENISALFIRCTLLQLFQLSSVHGYLSCQYTLS